MQYFVTNRNNINHLYNFTFLAMSLVFEMLNMVSAEYQFLE